jgi:hypothetical protein
VRKELRETRTFRGIAFSVWWDAQPGANRRGGYWRWSWRHDGRSGAGVSCFKTIAAYQARASIAGDR